MQKKTTVFWAVPRPVYAHFKSFLLTPLPRKLVAFRSQPPPFFFLDARLPIKDPLQKKKEKKGKPNTLNAVVDLTTDISGALLPRLVGALAPRAALGGARHLGVTTSSRSTSAARSSPATTTAPGLPGETPSGASLAARTSGLITTTSTASPNAASGGVVVASSVSIGLGPALLNRDLFAIHGVRVGGDRSIVAGLGCELNEGTVLFMSRLATPAT